MTERFNRCLNHGVEYPQEAQCPGCQAETYEKAKAEAEAASVSDVARWMEGQHDYAEQKDQPWFARAADILRTSAELVRETARRVFEPTYYG
jgi:hypothetical protein